MQHFFNDYDHGRHVGTRPGYMAFRTPKLLPIEEEKLFQLWSMILDVCDLEARARDDSASKALFHCDARSIMDLDEDMSAEDSIRHLRLGSRRRYPGTFSPRQGSSIRTAASSISTVNSIKSMASIDYEDDSHAVFHHEFRTAFWLAIKDDHPDEILFRFLKRQKLNPQAAFDQIVDTLRWRSQEAHVDDIMMSGEHGAYQKLRRSSDPKDVAIAKGFLQQFWQGKAFVRGVDRSGRPIVYTRAWKHFKSAQPAESMRHFIIYLIELTRIIVGPSIDTALFIFDFTHASPRNHDAHIIMWLNNILTTYYPGAVGTILVHRAPVWYPPIWKLMIKPFISTSQAADVHFTSSVADLERFIERDQIIAELGGDDAWTYDYHGPPPEPEDADPDYDDDENAPLRNAAARHALLAAREAVVQQFEKMTRAMVDADRAGSDISALRAARDETVDRLRENFWHLDPHVRARCVYDRWGALDGRRDAALNNANWLGMRDAANRSGGVHKSLSLSLSSSSSISRERGGRSRLNTLRSFDRSTAGSRGPASVRTFSS